MNNDNHSNVPNNQALELSEAQIEFVLSVVKGQLRFFKLSKSQVDDLILSVSNTLHSTIPTDSVCFYCLGTGKKALESDKEYELNKASKENNSSNSVIGRFGFIDIPLNKLYDTPLEIQELFNTLNFIPIESHSAKKNSIARYFGVSSYFDFFEPSTGLWSDYPLYRYSIKNNSAGEIFVNVKKVKKGDGYYGIHPRGSIGEELTYEYHYPDYWEEFNNELSNPES